MTESEIRALISLPDAALVKRTPGADRVLSAMVEEAVSLARQHQNSLQVSRSTIGDHELCEPDYRQILRWAADMELEPTLFLAACRT